MPKDIKGQNYRKGDYLVYVPHSENQDAIILFRSEGPYRSMPESIKSKTNFFWSNSQRYMSTVSILKRGLFRDDQFKDWIGMEGRENNMLKIPKRLCEPEVKTADTIAFVHLAGYTYQGKPYDNR